MCFGSKMKTCCFCFDLESGLSLLVWFYMVYFGSFSLSAHPAAVALSVDYDVFLFAGLAVSALAYLGIVFSVRLLILPLIGYEVILAFFRVYKISIDSARGYQDNDIMEFVYFIIQLYAIWLECSYFESAATAENVCQHPVGSGPAVQPHGTKSRNREYRYGYAPRTIITVPPTASSKTSLVSPLVQIIISSRVAQLCHVPVHRVRGTHSEYVPQEPTNQCGPTRYSSSVNGLPILQSSLYGSCSSRTAAESAALMDIEELESQPPPYTKYPTQYTSR